MVDQLGDDIYGLGMTVNRSPWTAYFFAFCKAFNADVFNSDGNVIHQQPESVEAMNYFADCPVEQGCHGSTRVRLRALLRETRLIRRTAAWHTRSGGQGGAFDNQLATPMPLVRLVAHQVNSLGHWRNLPPASTFRKQ